MSEQESYRASYEEFVRFATKVSAKERKKRTAISAISELCPRICEEFASYLKTTAIAVDTHNRKIKRLRKIFDCLKDYYDGDNPFRSKTLLCSEREEQSTVVRSFAHFYIEKQ